MSRAWLQSTASHLLKAAPQSSSAAASAACEGSLTAALLGSVAWRRYAGGRGGVGEGGAGSSFLWSKRRLLTVAAGLVSTSLLLENTGALVKCAPDAVPAEEEGASGQDRRSRSASQVSKQQLPVSSASSATTLISTLSAFPAGFVATARDSLALFAASASAGGDGKVRLVGGNAVGAAVGAAAPPPAQAGAANGGARGGGNGPQGPAGPLFPSSLFGLPLEELGLQLGVGSVAGFCSGYAVKKLSKAVALCIGLGFIAVQVLHYQGIIKEMDWNSVNDRLVEALDADQDGKVTGKDLQIHANKLVEILGFNVPSGAAFGTAFVLGLRYG